MKYHVGITPMLFRLSLSTHTLYSCYDQYSTPNMKYPFQFSMKPFNGPSSPAPCAVLSYFFNNLKKRPDCRKCIRTSFFFSGHSKHSRNVQRSRNIPRPTQLLASGATEKSCKFYTLTSAWTIMHRVARVIDEVQVLEATA